MPVIALGRRRPRPAVPPALSLLLAVLALVACGPGDLGGPATRAEVVQAVAHAVRTDFETQGITKAQATCVARRLADDVGTDRSLAVVRSDLGDDEARNRRSFARAFGRCVPSSAYVAPMVETAFRDLGWGAPERPVVSCAVRALEGRTGELALESYVFESRGRWPTLVPRTLSRCVPDRTTEDNLSVLFPEVPAEVLDCLTEHLFDRITWGDLLRYGQQMALTGSTAPPPELRALALSAGARCGRD